MSFNDTVEIVLGVVPHYFVLGIVVVGTCACTHIYRCWKLLYLFCFDISFGSSTFSGRTWTLLWSKVYVFPLAINALILKVCTIFRLYMLHCCLLLSFLLMFILSFWQFIECDVSVPDMH